MRGTKVLVTGADGFIGSHLVERLIKEGAQVTALVQYNAMGRKGWLESLEQRTQDEISIVSGDIRDPHFCVRLVQNNEIIFHLAALIAIPYSYHAGTDYANVNLLGTLNLLEACRLHGIKKFVHTSTSEVYGSAQYVPIDENHPLNGQSPYAASKIAADHYVHAYSCSHDVPSIIARPFNTFGPRQSARAVIPTIILQLLNKKNKIRLGALETTRDFNYVFDTVGAFLQAGQSDITDASVFNFGSGYEVSIGQLVEEISMILNCQVEIETDTLRLRPQRSEVERLLSCSKKAKNILGWKGQYHGREGFQKALSKTIDWFSAAKNMAYYSLDEYVI